MTIVVIGGSGRIGNRLVNRLRDNCLDVISTSLATGVNTVTGEGLEIALEDIEVVVDMTNSPSFEDEAAMHFFRTSTRNILNAEKAAGVKHHVALSVVGTERLQASGYFRAKLAQETLIRESPIPYTILRSTQFFEFLGGIADASTVGETTYVSPALVQPIAADDIAAALVDVVIGAPVNGMVEAAGPERFSLAQLVKMYLLEIGDPRVVVADEDARYFGARLHDDSLVPGANPRLGSLNFEAWLSQSSVKA